MKQTANDVITNVIFLGSLCHLAKRAYVNSKGKRVFKKKVEYFMYEIICFFFFQEKHPEVKLKTTFSLMERGKGDGSVYLRRPLSSC